MKQYWLLIFYFFSLQTLFSQVDNSVLSSGDWFKFSVDTTGVFKIDRTLLQRIGISASGLNPKKIHIYGNGGQLLPVVNSDFRYDDLQENADKYSVPETEKNAVSGTLTHSLFQVHLLAPHCTSSTPSAPPRLICDPLL